MSKLINFLLILVVFNSCNNPADKLQGIWIASYGFQDESDIIRTVQSVRLKVIEFENNKIHIKTFHEFNGESRDTAVTYEFSFSNNTVHYGEESWRIESIEKDSFVVFRPNNTFIVYKKVEIRESPMPEFDKDLYEFTFNEWKDTIQFVDGGLLMRINEYHTGNGWMHRWYISNYKKLKFLVIIGQFEIPYLITKVDSFKTEIQLYKESTFKGSIKKVDLSQFKHVLEGKWQMSNGGDVLALLPCFDRSGTLVIQDSIGSVTFKKDELIINQFGRTENIKYWKDMMNRFLVIEVPNDSSECSCIDLSWLNDSTISMEIPMNYRKIILTKQSK